MQMQFENSIENGKCEDDNNKVSDVKGIISFLHLVQDLKVIFQWFQYLILLNPFNLLDKQAERMAQNGNSLR